MKRYTVQEAAYLLALNNCEQFGHSWTFLMADNKPVQMHCDDCGWVGTISMNEYPKRPEGVEI